MRKKEDDLPLVRAGHELTNNTNIVFDNNKTVANHLSQIHNFVEKEARL